MFRYEIKPQFNLSSERVKKKGTVFSTRQMRESNAE